MARAFWIRSTLATVCGLALIAPVTGFAQVPYEPAPAPPPAPMPMYQQAPAPYPAPQPTPAYQQPAYQQPPQQPYPAPMAAPVSPTPQTYYPHNQGLPSPAPASARTQDDRKLNKLATEFYAIQPTDLHAIAKLKRLERQVRGFREDLPYEGYDARDILHDAKKLEHRIVAERERLESQHSQAAPAPQPTLMPAPVTPVGSSNLEAPGAAPMPPTAPMAAPQPPAPPPPPAAQPPAPPTSSLPPASQPTATTSLPTPMENVTTAPPLPPAQQ